MNSFAFQLWREYKLSIAEIYSIFPSGKIEFYTTEILLISGISKEKLIQIAPHMWGVIKFIEILPSTSPVQDTLVSIASAQEWKFKYGLSIFWKKIDLKKQLTTIKSALKKENISSRFVNKDFKNLSSSQILWEKLVQKGTDFSLIHSPLANKEESELAYLGATLWVQNIYSYSQRDWGKWRDMQVGMLPPKLSQIMINLSSPLLAGEGLGVRSKKIYDPFVWLGTILIESLHMWNTHVYGSDISDAMVEVSEKNIAQTIEQNSFDNTEYHIEKLNAKFIEESEILKNNSNIHIVTEWYLGEIMTQKNISLERIEKQQESLLKIYEAFFAGLKKINFIGNIVISFPFWDIKWKYIYFTDVYNVLSKYCTVCQILPENIWLEPTKSWSLLYKREKQLVGREIFKLTIK